MVVGEQGWWWVNKGGGGWTRVVVGEQGWWWVTIWKRVVVGDWTRVVGDWTRVVGDWTRAVVGDWTRVVVTDWTMMMVGDFDSLITERITVLGRGPVFQWALANPAYTHRYTYHNDTIMTLQKMWHYTLYSRGQGTESNCSQARRNISEVTT